KRSHIELARETAKQIYDPENQGTSYDIEYRGHGRLGEPGPDRGIGRVYHPFTDAQLSAALWKASVYPDRILRDYCRALPPLRLPRSGSIFNIRIKRTPVRRRPPEPAQWYRVSAPRPIQLRFPAVWRAG